MLHSLIFNISVTISGIYLFHRLQFHEEKSMNFSKNYITFLMTLISLLLLTESITVMNISISLAFVPLLFLGRYTNVVYTLLSASIIFLVEFFIFHTTLMNALPILVIGLAVSLVGPFIKSNHFIAIQWLNLIAITILGVFITIMHSEQFIQYMFVVTATSYLLSVTSALLFVDIWNITKLIKRYKNEHSVDFLTGLGNVRLFDKELNRLSRQADTKKESLSLLLIDIDGFKDVNDKYGHTAGDAVLRQMAQVLINYLPDNIPSFRNGGEEFSAILNGSTLDEAIKLAESIRVGVKNSTFHLPNKETINLTVSIGVGYLQEGQVKSHRKIFKDADDMLHAAKAQGNNAVMFNPIIK